jgi:membrane protease YdiL (CAAX protease family)
MPAENQGQPKVDKLAIALRIGVYAFLALAGMIIFPRLMIWAPNMYFVGSALSSFAAAAVANAIALRIYEHGQLADIGMGWTVASRRNLLIGAIGGAGAAILAVLTPVALRLADIVRVPESGFNPGAILFVTVVLLFGAIGEEMLFRGYAFQVLIGFLGPFATILPFGILFAFAHLGNPGQGSAVVGWVAPVNTALWGFLLGYAFVLSGDLWLPIGLHFGWNWVLPLLGANLSGFTMGVTGLGLRSRGGDLWTGGAYGPEGGLFTTLILVVLAFALYRAPVERQTPVLVRSAEAWS